MKVKEIFDIFKEDKIFTHIIHFQGCDFYFFNN
jgi:hypothetical protein